VPGDRWSRHERHTQIGQIIAWSLLLAAVGASFFVLPRSVAHDFAAAERPDGTVPGLCCTVAPSVFDAEGWSRVIETVTTQAVT
jgi:hypothetical protein